MPATQTKPAEKVRFEADGTGLRIVLRSMQEVFGENGLKQPIAGTGRYAIFQPNGHGGQFFETSDPDVIEVLRAKSRSDDPKFFEVPIPVPASAPVLSQIVKLLTQKDIEGLVSLAQEEQETHQRKDVIEAIADALESLKE